MPIQRLIVATLLASPLMFAGCATEPPSLYQRLGGRAAIEAMVNDSIVNISADTRINQRFHDLDAAKLGKNLVDLVCERTGGPCVYTGKDMSAAHEGMYISDAEFDALVEDMVKSMDKFKMPAREKAEVLALLGKTKNAIVGH
jgi:hemoglobin